MKKLMLVLLLSAAVSSQYAIPKFPGVDLSNNCQCIGIGIETPKPEDFSKPVDGTKSAGGMNLVSVYMWVILYLTGVGK